MEISLDSPPPLVLVLLLIATLSASLHFLFFSNNKKKQTQKGSTDHHAQNTLPLPPGKIGFPVIGETLEFFSTGRKGHPEKFFFDRIAKHSSSVFKTGLFGSPFVVLCGAAGNKFLFSNEDKLVQSWWPSSIGKIFPSASLSSSKKEIDRLRTFLPNFFKPDTLQRYVGSMDRVAQRHFACDWDNKDQVVVLPLTKRYSFLLACCVFLSLEDLVHIDRFAGPFRDVFDGLFSIPIDFPGTSFYRGIKASNFVRKELVVIIKQRKTDLAEGKASPTQDLLSHMLASGELMDQWDLADKIFVMLVGGYNAPSSTCATIVKYLAQLPEVYQGVYKEQMEIANSKAPEELLGWKDIQKMKYSWNVACEAMRLAPPNPGTFREAIIDFTYNGFLIPKGWKLHWSPNLTHKDPEIFPEPEKFDPSRFERSRPAPFTFVPFGGGPRMCPGQELGRVVLLIFMHHVVKRFRWEMVFPKEKIIVSPMPIPEKGLPIRLYPHQA